MKIIKIWSINYINMIWWQEVIGYAGMAFIIVSFLMKKVTLLRLLNVIGGALSCIYGLLTKTYPTMALNLILVCINFAMPIDI